MKPMMEFSAFLGLALGAHVIIWTAGTGGPAGALVGPEAGPEAVMLTGASTSLQSMVADWDRPPSMAPDMATMAMTPPKAMPITTPAPLTAPPAPPKAPALLPARVMEQPLASDTPPPPPPPKAKPAPKAKPQTNAPAASGSGPKAKAKSGTASATSSAGSDSTGKPAKATAKTSTKTDPNQMARWGGAIRSSIERRKKYPSGSRAKGSVSLAITVSHSGALSGLSIAKSSGDAALDRAALDAVKRARLPKAPTGIPAGSHRFTLSVAFAR